MHRRDMRRSRPGRLARMRAWAGGPSLLTSLLLWVAAGLAGGPAGAAAATTYEVIGDAVPTPLGGLQGSAERGRALVVNRREGLCLLCHSGPFPEERFQGNLAPNLAGAGSRWNAGQLRLRLIDTQRLNPDTVMPAHHRHQGLQQVATRLQGHTLFTAQQIEDVVSFLQTLRD
jgi:sulfur-oxidizing protein SoxX